MKLVWNGLVGTFCGLVLLGSTVQAADMICSGSVWDNEPIGNGDAGVAKMERYLTVAVFSADGPQPRINIQIDSIEHFPNGGSTKTLKKIGPIDENMPGYKTWTSPQSDNPALRVVSVKNSNSVLTFQASFDPKTLSACKTDTSGGYCQSNFYISGVAELAKTSNRHFNLTSCAVF